MAASISLVEAVAGLSAAAVVLPGPTQGSPFLKATIIEGILCRRGCDLKKAGEIKVPEREALSAIISQRRDGWMDVGLGWGPGAARWL